MLQLDILALVVDCVVFLRNKVWVIFCTADSVVYLCFVLCFQCHVVRVFLLVRLFVCVVTFLCVLFLSCCFVFSVCFCVCYFLEIDSTDRTCARKVL